MTAQDHDPMKFDTQSKLKIIPREISINEIFRFLNAEEVFMLRGVCH
jgi:hypothetical protein